MAIEGQIYFDPKDRIYNDHFPGNPVVPGTLIIDAFVKILGDPNIKIENFRYRNFLSPGLCSYRIEKKEKGWKCSIYNVRKTFATGMLIKETKN